MSDVMLLGALRMPPECWVDNPVCAQQRHDVYVNAANKIDELKNQVEKYQMFLRQIGVDDQIETGEPAQKEG